MSSFLNSRIQSLGTLIKELQQSLQRNFDAETKPTI